MRITPSPLDHLTERARLAVLLARQEAVRRGDSEVGALHLVAGLVREDEGLAAELLAHHGVRLEAVRAAGSPAAAGPVAERSDDPPLGAVARRVLERAAQEARWLDREHAATEHLLLGVLHEGDGPAIRLLLDAGLSEAGVHGALVRRFRRRR